MAKLAWVANALALSSFSGAKSPSGANAKVKSPQVRARVEGNPLGEKIASLRKRPRVPSFRISGLHRRHHSTVLEDKFEAQNAFFDVTQSQSRRDSAELAR